MAGLPGSNRLRPAYSRSRAARLVIADPDAEIRLQRAETEIEQDGFAIFLAGCVIIRANFRQRGTLVHRAIMRRQA